VLLGLPPDLSPLPPASDQARNKGADNFDGPATEAADIASTLITEFRRHLKTCSKLPASLSVLMQGAIRALQTCQPYAMLPKDRYGEWKVLDLSFTPQDFSAS
jgi:hypothetical protein